MNKTYVLLLLVAMAVLADPGPAAAQDTERVFVVIIDGLRNEEAFEDPDHTYIPHIWNDLRPQGTILTEFYNDFLTTYTTPGHEAIVSGVWHLHPNLVDIGFNDCRVESPTIFEYFRKHTGAPQESCLIVTGKVNNMQLDWSLDPAYGPAYGSLIFQGGTDNQTYALLDAKLQEHSPDLVLVNFRDVDEIAHENDWEGYLAAIANADHLVYRIWTELIQGNPYYANKTTLIVTSDHGRNGPPFTFQHHGGMSHYNRHVPFLAIGPDTPAGVEVTDKRFLIDIAPTVGELLGFPTPYARGQVMTALFEPGLDPDPRIHVYQRNAQISSYWGGAAVTWSENDPSDTGNERVYVIKKAPSDADFSAPALVSNPGAARWAFYPDISANLNGLHLVWLDGRALDGENETWSVFYRKSEDWGLTWQDEKVIVTSVFGDPAENTATEVIGEPEIISTNIGELIVTVRYKSQWFNNKITSFRSGDQGNTWQENVINDGNHFPRQYCAIPMALPWEAGVTWVNMTDTSGQPGNFNWEVWFKRTLNGGVTWMNLSRMSWTAGYSDKPQLAWGGLGRLLTVWAERDVAGSPWQVNCRASTNKGWSWGTLKTIASGGSAWCPSATWNGATNKFFLVWTDTSAGFPDLKYSTSTDGVSWAAPQPIAGGSNGAFRANPQAAYASGKVWVVWEEQIPDTGDWLIQRTSL